MGKPRDRETVLAVGIGTLAILLVVAFLVLAPSGGDFGPRDVPGPSEPRPAAIAEHADQFEEEVPIREAGSQQEQAAATYILGIMQRNGYNVRLDAVPVSNLVSSTNLIALPPGLDEPETVVVVPYDTTDSRDPYAGESLGLLLETARALNVADPEHTTAWIAIGAERAQGRKGERLGSRRLARFMVDEGWDPHVVRIGSSDDFATTGDAQDAFRDAFREVEGEEPPDIALDTDIGLYQEAGFTETIALGPPGTLGRVLLEVLRS